MTAAPLDAAAGFGGVDAAASFATPATAAGLGAATALDRGDFDAAAALDAAPDLVAADLVAPDLVAADLVAADLVAADLVAADLVAADLVAADLVAADLVAADLVATADLVAAADFDSRSDLEPADRESPADFDDVAFDARPVPFAAARDVPLRARLVTGSPRGEDGSAWLAAVGS